MSVTMNTLVTILRGQTTDAYGDSVEVDNVVASDVPCSILETGSNATRPADGRTDNVRNFTARCSRKTDIRRDDRLRDQKTQRVYTVDEVITPLGTVGHNYHNIRGRRVT